MKIVQFHPDHLTALKLQPSQQWLRSAVDSPEYAQTLVHADAFTAMSCGRPVAVGALIEIWPGRAIVTALLSSDIGSELLPLTRYVSGRLDAQKGRVEATVDGDFKPGHRWLKLLGFTLETPDGMPSYLPTGEAGYLYARVQ